MLAADGETVPAEVSPLLAAYVHFLVAPGGGLVEYLSRALGIIAVKAVEQTVRECDAPTVRHPSRIAFDDGDIVIAIAQLRGDGEVQTCRSATDTHDFHASLPPP